jgi:hypothetical protein
MHGCCVSETTSKTQKNMSRTNLDIRSDILMARKENWTLFQCSIRVMSMTPAVRAIVTNLWQFAHGVTKAGARLTSLLMSTIESILLNYRASLLLASSTLYPQPQERAGTCKKTNIMCSMLLLHSTWSTNNSSKKSMSEYQESWKAQQYQFMFGNLEQEASSSSSKLHLNKNNQGLLIDHLRFLFATTPWIFLLVSFDS